jgi:hypothetical protein
MNNKRKRKKKKKAVFETRAPGENRNLLSYE